MYEEDTQHNWRLVVELRNGASAKIIASDTKCLSRSCDDVIEIKRPEMKQQIPWDEFFAECKKKFPENQFKTPALGEKFTDECEKDYASEYGLLEWCDKVKDRALEEQCYIGVAIARRDPSVCQSLLIGDRREDCFRSVRG